MHVSVDATKQWQTCEEGKGAVPGAALLEGRHFSYNCKQKVSKKNMLSKSFV